MYREAILVVGLVVLITSAALHMVGLRVRVRVRLHMGLGLHV